MKNVIAYIRVSTDEQMADDCYGMEAQKRDIIDYCSKHDCTIVKWVADEGESGAKYRPGFDSIIFGADTTNPPFQAVVVAKSDRVARDVEIYFYYSGALNRKGIELISVCEDFGKNGDIFAKVLKSFTLTCAAMERDNIMKRTSAGRTIKASYGGYSGGRCPYGYNVSNHQLVINPEEAEVVREIIRMKFDEGKPFRYIVAYLNEHGRKNKSGTDFAVSTVQVICDNKKLYEGYYKYGKNAEWVKGQHEPILIKAD